MHTLAIQFQHLHLAPNGARDSYDKRRAPAVWQLDDDPPHYVIVAGRKRYLDLVEKGAQPTDLITARVVEAATFADAVKQIRETRIRKAPAQAGAAQRPLAKTIRNLIQEIENLDSPTPEELCFLNALRFVAFGEVKNWPPRIYNRKYG
jgi:hypothetical protein